MKMKFVFFSLCLSILGAISIVGSTQSDLRLNTEFEIQRKSNKMMVKQNKIQSRGAGRKPQPKENKILCSTKITKDCYLVFDDIVKELKKKLKSNRDNGQSLDQNYAELKNYYGKNFQLLNRKTQTKVYGNLKNFDIKTQTFEFNLEGEKNNIKFNLNDSQYSAGDTILIGGKLLEIENNINPALSKLLDKNQACNSRNIRTDIVCQNLWQLNSIPCYPIAYEYENFNGRSMELKINSIFINYISYKIDPKNFTIYFKSFKIRKGLAMKITYVAVLNGLRMERIDPLYYHEVPKLNYSENDVEIYIEVFEIETFRTIAELPAIYNYLHEVRLTYAMYYNAEVRKTTCLNELQLIKDNLEIIRTNLRTNFILLKELSSKKFDILTDEQIQKKIMTNQNIIKYNKDIKLLKEQIDKLEKKYKEFEAHNVTLKKLIESNLKNRKCQQELLDKKTFEKGLLSDRLEKLSKEYEVIQRNIHSLAFSINSSTTFISNYQDQIAKLNKLIEAENKKIENWNAELTVKKQEESQCVQKKEHTSELVKVLIKEIKNVDATIKEMENSNADMQDKINTNNSEMQSITTKVGILNSDLLKVQNDKKTLVFEINRAALKKNLETRRAMKENDIRIDEVNSDIDTLKRLNDHSKNLEFKKDEECNKLIAKYKSREQPLTRAISVYTREIRDFTKMSGVINSDSLLQLMDVYMNPKLVDTKSQLLKDTGDIYNNKIASNTQESRRRYKRIKRKLRRMRLI